MSRCACLLWKVHSAEFQYNHSDIFASLFQRHEKPPEKSMIARQPIDPIVSIGARARSCLKVEARSPTRRDVSKYIGCTLLQCHGFNVGSMFQSDLDCALFNLSCLALSVIAAAAAENDVAAHRELGGTREERTHYTKQYSFRDDAGLRDMFLHALPRRSPTRLTNQM